MVQTIIKHTAWDSDPHAFIFQGIQTESFRKQITINVFYYGLTHTTSNLMGWRCPRVLILWRIDPLFLAVRGLDTFYTYFSCLLSTQTHRIVFQRGLYDRSWGFKPLEFQYQQMPLTYRSASHLPYWNTLRRPVQLPAWKSHHLLQWTRSFDPPPVRWAYYQSAFQYGPDLRRPHIFKVWIFKDQLTTQTTVYNMSFYLSTIVEHTNAALCTLQYSCDRSNRLGQCVQLWCPVWALTLLTYCIQLL